MGISVENMHLKASTSQLLVDNMRTQMPSIQWYTDRWSRADKHTSTQSRLDDASDTAQQLSLTVYTERGGKDGVGANQPKARSTELGNWAWQRGKPERREQVSYTYVGIMATGTQFAIQHERLGETRGSAVNLIAALSWDCFCLYMRRPDGVAADF